MSKLDTLYKHFRPYASAIEKKSPQSYVGLIIYSDGSGHIEQVTYRYFGEYTKVDREYPVKFKTISEGIRKLEALDGIRQDGTEGGSGSEDNQGEAGRGNGGDERGSDVLRVSAA